MTRPWTNFAAALVCGLSLAGAPVPAPPKLPQLPKVPPQPVAPETARAPEAAKATETAKATGAAQAQETAKAPGASKAPVLVTVKPPAPAFVYALEPELVAAVASKELKGVVDPLQKKLVEQLTDLEKLDRARLVPLAASWQFARYFSRVEAPSDDHWSAMKRLTERPRFATRLVLGLGENDAPDHVLELAGAVCKEDGKNRNCDDWADLAAALCVVWDTPSDTAEQEDAKSDARQAALLFRYYTNAARRLQFDPKTLPFELLVYVVDNNVDRDEIAWALDQYGRRASVGGIYFDVPYDLDTAYKTGRHLVNGRPLTLPELRRVGGLCADQAYFATMVGRSLGVPSVTSTGRGLGSDGTAHAWVGYLERGNPFTRWNFHDGRYESQQYFRGDVVDPQSRLRVPESEVALSAESLHGTLEDRLTSAALVACVELVDAPRRPDLLMRAASLYPGNRAAWLGLAQLGADRALAPGQADQIASTVVKAMVDPYPEFALEILTRLNSGRGTAQQFTALERMKELFKNRPDIMADLTLAQGDLRKAERKPDDALRLYGSVIEGRFSMGPIVLSAMDRIDTLLSASGDTGRLAQIYHDVWARMPAPDVNVNVRSNPYYLIGRHYAATLEPFNTPAARAEIARVEAKLESLDAAVSAAGR